MPEYTVKQGDCLSSIAQKYGLFWEKVWNHSKNAELKESRNDPNVLYPGDVVFVPDKEEKEESCATEQRHRFRKKGVPTKLQVQLFNADNEPRGNVEYLIEIDGELHSGRAETNGWIRRSISPNAKRARLIVIEEGIEEEYYLNLGHLDPIDQIGGVQQRLNNLGFDCGVEDGKVSEQMQVALKEFQRKHDLEATGTVDDATSAKLEEVYGC